MTHEQLDEIETLAATWLGKEKDFYATGRDAAMHQFLIAMREHALPLVKALREALSLKQQWAADADAKKALLQSVAKVCRGMKEPDEADLSVLGNVLRERDEARAAIAAHKSVSDSTCASLTSAYPAVARERDEARAERDALQGRDERWVKIAEQYERELDEYRRRIGTLLDQLAKEEADAHQFQKERDVARARLSNLLARIHRDGGHYEAKNGTAKAVVDADVAMAQAFAEHDEARAEVERLKQSVSTLDKLYVSRTDELRESEAEVERLRAERDEARKWLEGICVEFESTIAHAEWRAAGSKGMSVPFFGDFADAARHPGMIGRMGWWVRQFRAALKEGDR